MRFGLRITLAALLAAGLASSLFACTILDELDDANKKMKVGEPSPGQKPADSTEQDKSLAKSKKPEPGILDKVLAWTKKETQPGPKPHDPKDPIVKCLTNGSVSFVYKFDCQQNGGVVMGEHKA